MKKTKLLLTAVLSTLLLASCSKTTSEVMKVSSTVLSATGIISRGTRDSINKAIDASNSAEITFSLEEEYYIGRGVAANLLSKYRILDNPKATDYVNHVLQTMIAGYGATQMFNGYHAVILDSEEINAFATSGGHVLVTKGLIKAAGTEDALAAVLAHELAHIQLGHSIQAIKSERKKNANKAITSAAFQATIDIGTSESESDSYYRTSDLIRDVEDAFEEVLGDTIDTLINNGYSQNFEFEADRCALDIMSFSGYDVYAMDDMLYVLSYKTPKGSGGFGKTHPSPKARMENLKKEYKKRALYETDPIRTQRYKENIDRL